MRLAASLAMLAVRVFLKLSARSQLIAAWTAIDAKMAMPTRLINRSNLSNLSSLSFCRLMSSFSDSKFRLIVDIDSCTKLSSLLIDWDWKLGSYAGEIRAMGGGCCGGCAR